MKVKAVCVMRTDLRNSDGFKVPKGKLIAQGGHAFVGLILKFMNRYNCFYGDENYLELYYSKPITTAESVWINGKFTKIVLAIDSEKELLDITVAAEKAGLNYCLIEDCGDTEFHKPTLTCVGIGPDWEDKIDLITGHLKGFS